MLTSISVSTSVCGMSPIMFNGNWEQCVQPLADLGYEGLDLFIIEPLQIDISHVAKVLDDAGLQVSMLAAQGDIMAAGYFLNDPSSERRKVLLEKSKRHLEMAAQLRTKPNIGFIRGNLPKEEDKKYAGLQYMAEGVREYCELAATFGLGVLFEPFCRYEINSCNTVAQSLELFSLAGEPHNLQLLLDIFHMNIEEASLVQAIVNARGKIGHVHFVDNTRAVPGGGCLPLETIYKALYEAEYKGFLGVEAIPGAQPMAEAEAAQKFIRALING